MVKITADAIEVRTIFTRKILPRRKIAGWKLIEEKSSDKGMIYLIPKDKTKNSIKIGSSPLHVANLNFEHMNFDAAFDNWYRTLPVYNGVLSKKQESNSAATVWCEELRLLHIALIIFGLVFVLAAFIFFKIIGIW